MRKLEELLQREGVGGIEPASEGPAQPVDTSQFGSGDTHEAPPGPPSQSIERLAGIGLDAMDEKDYKGTRKVLRKIQDVAEDLNV
jgi:hypothetical protein